MLQSGSSPGNKREGLYGKEVMCSICTEHYSLKIFIILEFDNNPVRQARKMRRREVK